MSELAMGVQIREGWVEAAVVAPNGAVIERLNVLVSASDLELLEPRVIDLVHRLRSAFDVETVGVVVGPPFEDDSSSRRSPDVWSQDRLLSCRLQEQLGLPVTLESEVRAACWGEFRFGAGQGVSNIVTVSLGAGVEGAVIVSSTLLQGAGGNAGSFAHLRLVEDGLPCGCGQCGCWDQYVSSTALSHAAKVEARRAPERSNRLLSLAHGDPGRVVSQHVARAAARDDPLALELFERLGAALGTGLATLTVMLDPDAIVIGGGLASSAQFYLPTSKAVLAGALPPTFKPPALLVAQRRDDAAIIGVADLCRRRGRRVMGESHTGPRTPAAS